jgi:hypothetical protein
VLDDIVAVPEVVAELLRPAAGMNGRRPSRRPLNHFTVSRQR